MYRVPIDEQVKRRIIDAVGDIDTSKISVYEVLALSSIPVTQGTIYDKMVHPLSLLTEIASVINSEARPVIIAHDDSELPQGTMFYAEAKPIPETGRSGLFTLIYVGKDTDIDEKMDLGIIKSVSIGLDYKHLRCPVCGFDFLGDEASYENVITQTCPEGHTLGRGGDYALDPEGIARVRELSLCAVGAIRDAKILPANQQILGKRILSGPLSLAASSGFINTSACFYNNINKEEEKMADKADSDHNTSLVQLSEKLGLLMADKALLEAKGAELESKMSDLKAEKEALESKLAELNEKDSQAAEDKAKVAEEKSELESIAEFMDIEAKKAAIIMNKKESDIPGKLSDKVKFIQEARNDLVRLFPMGGVSKSENELAAAYSDFDIENYREG